MREHIELNHIYIYSLEIGIFESVYIDIPFNRCANQSFIGLKKRDLDKSIAFNIVRYKSKKLA